MCAGEAMSLPCPALPSSPLSLSSSLLPHSCSSSPLPSVLLRESPQSQGVLLGDETTLTCSFEAGYFVTVEWMRDDNILRDEGGMTSPTGGGLGIYSSVLMISDAMFTDCASYRCFASGADTVYSQPAELSVAGEPMTFPYIIQSHIISPSPPSLSLLSLLSRANGSIHRDGYSPSWSSGHVELYHTSLWIILHRLVHS